MKNFIFKSSDVGLIKNVSNKLDLTVFKLDIIQKEQRHQRQDLADILRVLNSQVNNSNLQKQVNEYFEDKTEDIPEE